MEILVALLPVLIIGGMFYLLVITIRDALRLKGTEQIAWICLIFFLFPLGSIILLLAKPSKKNLNTSKVEGLGHVPRLHSAGPISTYLKHSFKLVDVGPCNEPPAHLTRNFMACNKLHPEGLLANSRRYFHPRHRLSKNRISQNKPRKKSTRGVDYLHGGPP
jgi:hypothetical protein